MPNYDIRLCPHFPYHPKLRKLQARLGIRTRYYLEDLWLAVRVSKPDGLLSNWSEQMVADAAGFRPSKRCPTASDFIRILLEERWLDRIGGVLACHEWSEHQPYAAGIARRTAELGAPNGAEPEPRRQQRSSPKSPRQASESDGQGSGRPTAPPNPGASIAQSGPEPVEYSVQMVRSLLEGVDFRAPDADRQVRTRVNCIEPLRRHLDQALANLAETQVDDPLEAIAGELTRLASEK